MKPIIPISVLFLLAVLVGYSSHRVPTSKPRHIIIYLSESGRITRVEDNSGFKRVHISGLEIETK